VEEESLVDARAAEAPCHLHFLLLVRHLPAGFTAHSTQRIFCSNPITGAYRRFHSSTFQLNLSTLRGIRKQVGVIVLVILTARSK